jgi:hypothetical protein
VRIFVSSASISSASSSVVVAAGVKDAVDEQVREMLAEGLPLLFGLAHEHRHRDHDVGHDDGLARVVEREHVRRVVAAAELVVELAALFKVDEAHGEFRVGLDGGAHPAEHDAAVGQFGELRALLHVHGERGRVLGHVGSPSNAQRWASAPPARS